MVSDNLHDLQVITIPWLFTVNFAQFGLQFMFIYKQTTDSIFIIV